VEQKLPFVPEAVVIYMSIYVLFWIAPFILRTRRALRALAITLALVTFCGGISFLLFPAELDFPARQDLGICAELFRFADWLNLDYNLVPSLHVALSVVCAAVFASCAGGTARIFLWLWPVAIGASAVLTYQHHLLDVLSGYLLGMLTTRLVYHRVR
jgi:membrane-associated phospholipid phosphatase